MQDYRTTWYRGYRYQTWTEPSRMWSRDQVHHVRIENPDGSVSWPGMTDARIRRHAQAIADSITEDARNSGPDPIAWVTGNSYVPPLRSFDLAEDIWQHPANEEGEVFEYLVECVENLLSAANVALECPDYDNALYAVDLDRFEYIDEAEREQDETLQDEWRLIPG